MPRLASSDPKTVRKFRCTQGQWAQLEAAAKKANLPVADLIRRIIDEHFARGLQSKRLRQMIENLEKRTTNLEAEVHILQNRNGGAR